MPPRTPMDRLPTHDVLNMPPYIGDQDLWADDRALRDWTGRMRGDSAVPHLSGAGARAGRETVFARADQANANPPEAKPFDRYGMRVNQVEFHPAYHELMAQAVSDMHHNYAWHHEGDNGHLGQAALTYMFAQAEGGVLCPMSMTYSAVPALRTAPEIAAEWMPRILSRDYDPRDIPASEKTGATLGMFMTEKQGGSDVRANTTFAVRGDGGWLLTGHKFFCSAPMSDAFLVLANTEGMGLSCFLVPRWRPDGTRNALFLQRLKDKLGNRSNASSEMEFQNTWGQMVGDEGRGVRTIIDMVIGNRIFCAMSSAGMMRQALVQALHHTTHRSAFQKRLIRQPLMQNVLADMAVETEACLALGLRVAHAMDNADDPAEDALARIGTAVAKYWNCKRCPSLVVEALECHGGPGYVEESLMPRLYREAPVNSIWEGSGNIMGLDVLRAMSREPESIAAVLDEVEKARGNDPRLDRAIDALRDELADADGLEGRMRIVTELIALTLQGALLTHGAPPDVAEAFCASRLGPVYRGSFGTLPKGCDPDAIIDRALPRNRAQTGT